MSLTIGYWSLRGLGEPVHLVLEYLGLRYEKKTYHYHIEDFQEWFAKDKLEIGMDYPNLPYLIDGDFKVAQTLTVLKYIGRKYGLFGSEDIQKLAKQEEVLDNIHFLRVEWAIMCYGEDYETKRAEYYGEQGMRNFADHMSYFEKVLGRQTWLAGENVFVGDFYMWHLLDINELCEPTCLDNFPNLRKFKAAVAELPRIAEYLSSDRYKKFPINASMAKWGGGSE
ncbi:glutathione S-transferase Mu 6-like [Symsagittifera roscoffensis]|uniref:glutathione S-transferase Mu 6-like n=1 Tax=Symsagittifera roscoffensis TaxID=84072 RepID=UPI00307B87E1